MENDKIFVTQPVLPDLNDFVPYLETIWNKKILTNGGPYHQQLEAELCEFLGVSYISLFSNATIALVTALQALEIEGEVITTPYSFVATAHSILWNRLTPVFVDIDEKTYNIDPLKIEAAINSNTRAIMPVHCYGNPCDYYEIDKIAKKHDLKVIYDAAHAFAIADNAGSILNHGDLSVLSFHATKVFNTFEGGAIICKTPEMKKRIDQLKNFGFVDELTVVAPGINGKMSELNAAFGLLQLKGINDAIAGRKKVHDKYKQLLKNITGIELKDFGEEVQQNYSYFPVIVSEAFHMSRDELYEHLKSHDVYARRYFYPLITDFPMYKDLPSSNDSNLPVAKKIASQVICLPIYPALSIEDVEKIVKLFRG